jgi:hypothetical protein
MEIYIQPARYLKAKVVSSWLYSTSPTSPNGAFWITEEKKKTEGKKIASALRVRTWVRQY